ncbi:hypothetical protein ACHAXM_004752 [Skeletonema potamos]
MTKARANRFLFWWWCIVLHLTLLQIISINSFQLGRNNPAFLMRSSSSIKNSSNAHAELSSTTITAEKQLQHSQQQQQQHKQHHRHVIFQHTNAVSKSFPIPHPNIWRKFVTPTTSPDESSHNPSFWEQLLPSSSSSSSSAHQNKKQNQLVNDITVQFDDPTIGAYELVKQCQLFLPQQHSDDTNNHDNNKQSTTTTTLPPPENVMMEQQDIIQHLTDILSYFQSVVSSPDTNNNNNNIKCQARIVSSIGKNGIKCPRWHADHVPVRLVMSIIGPGCEYIPHEVEVIMGGGGSSSSSNERVVVVDRNALNTLDEDDTRIANDIIVPPNNNINLNTGKKTTIITSAMEGDAVLLMGRAWEEEEEEDDDFTKPNKDVLAAVHRSPVLSPGQERILLTVDLVPPS